MNSTNSSGLDERYFVLITALERISNNYIKSNETSNKLIDDEIYQNEIKPHFKNLLNKLKKEVKVYNKSAWNIFASKIGELNRKNTKETKQKIYEFLTYSKININQSVIDLVENERNSAVHEGNFGETEEEKIKNYLKLDHILRDCIANLIGYDGIRSKKYDYDEEE